MNAVQRVDYPKRGGLTMEDLDIVMDAASKALEVRGANTGRLDLIQLDSQNELLGYLPFDTALRESMSDRNAHTMKRLLSLFVLGVFAACDIEGESRITVHLEGGEIVVFTDGGEGEPMQGDIYRVAEVRVSSTEQDPVATSDPLDTRASK